MGMRIDLRPGDRVQVGDIIVTLEEKSGQRARLNIEAPESVRINKQPAVSQVAAARSGLASLK